MRFTVQMQPHSSPRARRRNIDLALLLVLGLTLAVRLAWVLLVPAGQYSDSVWYDAAAWRLVSQGEYGVDGPSAWFPPGYSFFLAAIYAVAGHVQLAGKLGNVALGVGTTLFTYLLARRAFPAQPLVALLAGLILAIWPNLIFHTGILSSDLLAAFGFVAALWIGTTPVTSRRGYWVRAVVLGLLIGWMALVRPVSIILFAAIGLWWWISTRSFLKAVLLLVPVGLISALPVAAWTVRNYTTFGEAIPIATNGGYNFWQTNHRFADGNDTYWPWVPMDDPEYSTMRDADEFTKNREGYRYGIAYIREHPLHIFQMLPTKLFWLYHSDTSGFYEGALYAPMEGPSALADLVHRNERIVEQATFRYYALVMLLAAMAIAVAPNAWRWLLPMLTLPALLTFFHLFFHAKDRFHIPLAPFAAILAALTLVRIGGWLVALSRQLRRTQSVPSLADT